MPANVKGLSWFLAIAFIPTWLWNYLAVTQFHLSMANPVTQMGFAFFPAIAAFVTRKWITREGFADAGLRLRLGTAWPQYLLALFGPFALVAATMAVSVALGIWQPDLSGLDEATLGLPLWIYPLVPILTMPLYFGEEFGWTSYLRQRIFAGRPVAATLTTGLIWAVWHFPLALMGDYIHFGNLAIGLAVWTVSFGFQEILLSWLMARTGTVWPTCLAHAGNNMVLFLITGTLLERFGANTTMTMLLPTIPMAVLGIWIVATGRLDGTRRSRPRVPAAVAG